MPRSHVAGSAARKWELSCECWYLARQGTRALLNGIAERQPDPSATITGSFAAVRSAPVAAPALLVVYTLKPRDLAAELQLLPTETGADTVLIRPDNEVVFA